MLGRKFHISCFSLLSFFSHLPLFLPSLTRPLSCFLMLTTGAEAQGPQRWKNRALVGCLLHALLQAGSTQRFWHVPTDPSLGFPALSPELQGATGHRWHQTGNLSDNPENQNLYKGGQREVRWLLFHTKAGRGRTQPPSSQDCVSASARSCFSF